MSNELEKFPGIIKDELLANHCTFRIGGPADYFFLVKSTDEIKKLIDLAKESNTPYFIFGGGSNILFSDQGFRGLIIKLETQNITTEDNKLTADAGVKASNLIKFSIENGFSGLEKWIGLPGTIGGAVRGNAGCNGLETKDILTKATILDPKTGKIQENTNEDLKFSYRHSKIKDSNLIVLSATFQLEKDLTPEEQQKIMNDLRQTRLKKQPLGFTTGSFFKNPSKDKPAGLLIDQAGLKGKQIGNAKISEKHGNFLINLGNAKASDILSLAKLIKREVKAKFNIKLQEEVQILSEYGKKVT